jgi:hypothetical protein
VRRCCGWKEKIDEKDGLQREAEKRGFRRKKRINEEKRLETNS